MEKIKITSAKAPAALGPYSQAIKIGEFVFCSGQIPLDYNTGAIKNGTIEEQTKTVLNNLMHVLEAAGTGFDQVVKTTIFLKSMDDFKAVNTVYGTFFSEPFPARSTVEVAKLPLDARIEIEAIAKVK